ncbi:hypothetical protein GCM10029978_085020 [Actinoallomurus acanthiterrae]
MTSALPPDAGEDEEEPPPEHAVRLIADATRTGRIARRGAERRLGMYSLRRFRSGSKYDIQNI